MNLSAAVKEVEGQDEAIGMVKAKGNVEAKESHQGDDASSISSLSADEKQSKKKARTVISDSDSASDAANKEGNTASRGSPSLKKQKQDHSSTAETGGDHDLTTVKGQMAANPTMTQAQAKAAAKREYNRQNAARARQRNKDMVRSLQKQVADLTTITTQLQRNNEVLTAQVEVLQQQNRSLLSSQHQQQNANLPPLQPQQASPTIPLNLAALLWNSQQHPQLAQLLGGQPTMQSPASTAQQPAPSPTTAKPAPSVQVPPAVQAPRPDPEKVQQALRTLMSGYQRQVTPEQNNKQQTN
jgi:hypothetical protein